MRGISIRGRFMKTLGYLALTISILTIAACSGISRPISTAPTSNSPTPTPPSDPTTTPGTKLTELQAAAGWNSWGQLAPAYSDCYAPCQGITWSMRQGVGSPSLSGSTTAQFDIGGTTPYSDVLWSNPVIGQYSSQGLPDADHSLLPTLHNFIYDADFFVTDADVTQVLEFDVNMYLNGVGLTWGNQCNNLGEKDWDIWDGVNARWVSTLVPCKLINNGWNHVTIELQREPDNTLLFQSITLNGVTANLNASFAPISVPNSWWGITVNYQMDGDSKQSANTTYLDNLTLTYW
jgi:hypothetical protein